MSFDPFRELGLEPSFDIDPDALEAAYLRLSRETHPDHAAMADLSPAELAERLGRAARVNDAFRTLSDPWRRARALIDRQDAEAFEASKKLDPMFLAEAMELAEEVADCTPEARPALRDRLEERIATDLEAIRAALAAGDVHAAATRLHQSRYHQKARADLDAASA